MSDLRSELRLLPTRDPVPDDQVSRDLTGRVALVALDLAAFVETSGSADAGADRAATFLRDWARSVRGRAAGSAPAPTTAPSTASTTPLGRVADRLRLTDAEVTLLLLAGLSHEHDGVAATLRGLHPRALPYVTVGMATHLLADKGYGTDAVRRVLTEGSAVRSGVLELEDGQPFFERCLLVPEGLWPALHGLQASVPGVEPVELPDLAPGLEGWLELPPVRRATRALRQSGGCVVMVPTADPTVGLGRCVALAAACGRTVLAGRLAADDATAVARWLVLAVAADALPVVLAQTSADQHGPARLAWPVHVGPVLVSGPSESVEPPPEVPVVSVPLGPLAPSEHVRAWSGLAPDPALAQVLAARHPLDPTRTAQVCRDVRVVRDAQDAPVDLREVSAAIRTRAVAALPSGVVLLAPRADWSRLVLPADAHAQLRDAVSRLEHQGLVLDTWDMVAQARADRGVRILLTGLPGTGKSMAAEVLASALGTDLLVVDISRIVSKWIGETEKNLERVFDVAERTQAVLMLDEADALFGTRTQITDAHDRYANLETAYLLQRLDRFTGLCVLATNLRHNIDAAFLRRMDFVVELGLPDVAGRLALWRLHLPEHVRAGDVDLHELARQFAAPGGWIRNAAVAATFLAAPSGGPVRTDHLLVALRREYAKAGKPFPTRPDATPGRDLRAVRAIEAAVGASAKEEPA